jgi:threonine dehydrogenase-like Zn-dependent dehydrogenase
MQARVTGLAGLYDQAKQAVRLESDRPYVLQEAILACRKGGRLSLVGDYFGSIDNLPIGAAFNKGLTVKMGHASVQKYMRPLLERIQKGELNPSFIVTHTFQLDQAPHAYQIYDQKKDGAVKVVLKP